MLAREKKPKQNCTLFHSHFHGAFKVPFTKVPGAGWTFAATLPIIRKISHLGANHRVPFDLESPFSVHVRTPFHSTRRDEMRDNPAPEGRTSLAQRASAG